MIDIDQWFGFNADVRVDLNSFCDALSQAYGAVAHFLFLNN